MAHGLEPVLRRLFGEEGDVAADVEMQLVMAASAVAVSGIFLVSPIVSTLAGHFSVSEAQAGQVMTAYTAPTVVLIPLMGVLADRYGRRPVLVGGLLLFGVAGTATALATSFPVVLALRVVQGAGHAAIVPITITLMGDLYSANRETTAQGLRGASVQAVGLVSSPLAGALVLGAWYYPFLPYVVAFPLALWAWRVLPPLTPGGAPTLRSYVRSLWAAVTTPATAALLVSFTVRFSLTFGFFAFVSVLLARLLSGTAVASGLLVSVFGATAFLSTTQAGRLRDRWNAALVLLAGFAVSGTGLALVGLSRSYALLVPGVVLFGLGSGATSPMQKSMVTRMAARSVRAGSVSSAYVFQALGQTVGPLLIGVLLQVTSVSAAFLVLGAGGGLAGVCLAALAYRFGAQ